MKTLALLVFTLAFAAVAQADDQTLPVPGSLVEAKPATSLSVQGEAGAGQASDKVKIIKVNLDAKGNVMKGTGVTAPAYELDQVIPVSAGRYLVTYSSSYFVADVAEGEQKEIKLGKINVPKVDGSYTFKVSLDLTAKSEQLQRVLFTWLNPLTVSFNCSTSNDWGRVTNTWTETDKLSMLCAKAHGLSKRSKNYCAAYNGTNYEAMIGNFFQFNSDGSYSTVDLRFSTACEDYYSEGSVSIEQIGRIAVGNGIDGDFVSALPGTYILSVTNHSGKSQDRFGVVVK
jgi:hypothetical protein